MVIPKKLFWLTCLLLPLVAGPVHAANLSPKSLKLITGEAAIVKVSRVQGTPALANSNPAVISATLTDSTISVNAFAPGEANLSVTDSKGTKTVKVTVKPPMSISQDFIALNVGQSAAVSISNAAGKVKLANSAPGKASASVKGSSIGIKAKEAGTVTLTLRDSKTTRTLQVQVTGTSLGSVSGNTQGRLLASNCFQCHGTYGSGGFDRILRKSDLAEELNEFLNGEEDADGIMAAHMKGYTTEQLQLIADYLANP